MTKDYTKLPKIFTKYLMSTSNTGKSFALCASGQAQAAVGASGQAQAAVGASGQAHAVTESGQALVEFVLSLMVTLSFFFFFVKLTFIFSLGNYVHYVTFMGARAYMSAAANLDTQKDNAAQVMKSLLGSRWKSVLVRKGGNVDGMPGAGVGPGSYFLEFGDEAKEGNPVRWNQGASFAYSSTLEIFPWSKGGSNPIDMKLTSESWLGREESHVECIATKEKIKTMVNSNVEGARVIYDNVIEGC